MAQAPAEDPVTAKYRNAANPLIKAGPIPFPPSDTFIEIMKEFLDMDDLEFIKAYRTSSSLSMDELKKKLKLPEDVIEKRASKLAKQGFIFNQPSSSGVKVYRLLPLESVGVMEYNFMNPGNLADPKTKAKLQKLAGLYKKLMAEVADRVQGNYEQVTPLFKAAPPTDRTIPIYDNVGGSTVNVEINKTLEPQEVVLPSQTVEEIIKKFDDIAVGNCFCRVETKVLGGTCTSPAPLEVCFTFGKSARHTIAQGFMRKITKEEALKILKETDKAGLVHKVFHNGNDFKKEENSMCNCDKDCCHTFQFWRHGAIMMHNTTTYLSQVIQDGCTGCGTCVEHCPMDAISLNDDSKAVVDSGLCIGCGVCAHFCPENTIKLQKGLRDVMIMPPRKGK